MTNLEFCKYCGAGVGKFRRTGEGTCPKCVSNTSGADTGTTGAEGLSDELKRISQSLENPNASRIIAIVALDSLRNRLLAATQRAPVTLRQRLRELMFPKIVDDALITEWMWRDVDRIAQGLSAAPVTTPGRDEKWKSNGPIEQSLRESLRKYGFSEAANALRTGM